MMNRQRTRPLMLIAAWHVLAPPGLAAPPDARPRSPFEGVAGLEKPISLAKMKISLGDLVQQIATETGVRLTADATTADEPVAVVVKELPARRLLEELADLLDYLWLRRTGKGVSTSAAPSAGASPSEPGASPAFEITQDLAGKQREERLRQAVYAAIEKQFREQVRQYVRMAELSPQQLGEITAAQEQRQRELEKLSPEERAKRLNAPGAREQEERAGIARVMLSPIPRSLGQLPGRLTPQQWELLLRQGKSITFSTDPQPGERPLPQAVVTVLSTSRPEPFAPPEVVLFPNDPMAEALRRQRDRETQEQWAAAGAYRVRLWLDQAPSAPTGSSGGLYSLRVETGARITNAAGSFFMGAGPTAGLYIAARPLDIQMQQRAQEDTPRRRAEGESDPVFGARKPFKPDLKSLKDRPGRPPGARRPLRDLLPDVARTYDVQLISDAYWTSSPSLDLAAVSGQPVSLFQLLDRSAWFTHRWDRRDRLVRLRSRTWFFDRPREVPLRLARRWKELSNRYTALPLEEYLVMATQLSDDQWGSLSLVAHELGLPPIVPGYPSLRPALRLLATLGPAERQAVLQGKPLAMAQMTPPQRELFLAAVYQQSRLQGEPLDREAARAAEPPPTARFWLTADEVIRIKEQREEGPSYRDVPEGTLSESGGEAGAAPPAPGRRRRLTRLSFHLQYGEATDSHGVELIVASPPEARP